MPCRSFLCSHVQSELSRWKNCNDSEIRLKMKFFSMARAVLQEMQLIRSVSCTRKEFEEIIDLNAGGIQRLTRS